MSRRTRTVLLVVGAVGITWVAVSLSWLATGCNGSGSNTDPESPTATIEPPPVAATPPAPTPAPPPGDPRLITTRWGDAGKFWSAMQKDVAEVWVPDIRPGAVAVFVNGGAEHFKHHLPRDCGDPKLNGFFNLVQLKLKEIDRLLNSLSGITVKVTIKKDPVMIEVRGNDSARQANETIQKCYNDILQEQLAVIRYVNETYKIELIPW